MNCTVRCTVSAVSTVQCVTSHRLGEKPCSNKATRGSSRRMSWTVCTYPYVPSPSFCPCICPCAFSVKLVFTSNLDERTEVSCTHATLSISDGLFISFPYSYLPFSDDFRVDTGFSCLLSLFLFLLLFLFMHQ